MWRYDEWLSDGAVVANGRNKKTANDGGFFVSYQLLIFGYIDGDDIAKVTNQFAIDIAMDF